MLGKTRVVNLLLLTLTKTKKPFPVMVVKAKAKNPQKLLASSGRLEVFRRKIRSKKYSPMLVGYHSIEVYLLTQNTVNFTQWD